MKCPACGQENVQTALVCEFCKEVLKKRSSSRPAPAPAVEPVSAPEPAPAPSGWSTPALLSVALVSLGLGFGLRGLLWPARTETPLPVVLAAPPPSAPSAAPLAVAEVKPPPAVPTEQVVEAFIPAPAAPAAPHAEVAVVDPRAGLKRIVVPYEHLEGLAQRIIIPVTVNGRITVPMALDTGAPGTFISSRLAARAGVLREGDGRLLTVAAGIGGNTAAALVVLDSISVREARSEFVPATVTESLSDAWEGLVGMDFLAGYAVSIDTAEHVLVLTEQPARASAPAGHDEAWWRRTYSLLAGQRTTWKNVRVTLEERTAESDVSAGGDAESLKRLLSFAQTQDREAEVLANRLDRYASTHSVPLEWRRP